MYVFYIMIPLQYFEVSSAGESCGTIMSKPIAAKTVENGYLWWPLGVKWPPPKTMVKANLIRVSTHVNVMTGLVSWGVEILRHRMEPNIHT